MPYYDYECVECDDKVEVLQKITDKPLSECVKCNGKLNKIISSGVGIVFKGSGFYVNDYKN